MMSGYWNRPEETAAALDADGWYHSGDLAYADADGYLYIVDRVKDMIITGGENVYSSEVENALYDHPAVLEAAVFGVPDEQWGERVHAAIVLHGRAPSRDRRGADRALPRSGSPGTSCRGRSSSTRRCCPSPAPARSSSAICASRTGAGWTAR